MPILHPDPPRIAAPLISEREVLAALKTLPPEAHVFTRLAILDPDTGQDRQLDFLVLHPELGIVIITVPGAGVEPRAEDWVQTGPDGAETALAEAPGEQLARLQYLLLHFLKRAELAFVPQISRVLAVPALTLKAGQGLGTELPPSRILTREKLRQPFLALREAVSGGRPWEHWRALEQAEPFRLQPQALQGILDALTPMLRPAPPLTELLEAEGTLPDRDAQLILDHLAHNFSQGRYHVCGAPGSGKSLLSRKVARLWAAEGRRVLVVTCNKAHTQATQNALDDLIQTRQVVVCGYHDLAVNLLEEVRALPAFSTAEAFFNVDLPRAMAQCRGDLRARWDALVVDEAQDLQAAWLDPLISLLRDPILDPVLVLEDPAQRPSREHRPRIGQPWRLELNLRQGASLRRAAIQALPTSGWPLPAAAGEPDSAVHSRPSGSATWKKDLAEILEGFQSDGLQPGQVLILAPQRAQTLALRDGERLGPWPLNVAADWWDGDPNAVRFGTVQSFRGLEADAVVYLAPAYAHPDGPRLRYAAVTRARQRVVILEKALVEPLRPHEESTPPKAVLVVPSWLRPAAPLGAEAKAFLLAALRP